MFLLNQLLALMSPCETFFNEMNICLDSQSRRALHLLKYRACSKLISCSFYYSEPTLLASAKPYSYVLEDLDLRALLV